MGAVGGFSGGAGVFVATGGSGCRSGSGPEQAERAKAATNQATVVKNARMSASLGSDRRRAQVESLVGPSGERGPKYLRAMTAGATPRGAMSPLGTHTSTRSASSTPGHMKPYAFR